MKTKISLVITILFYISFARESSAQCLASSSISLTSNPGEVSIQYDFSVLANPNDHYGKVHFENTTTGNHFWSSNLTPVNNTLLYNLPENGNYNFIAITYSTVSPSCYDSVTTSNVLVSGLPQDCYTSISSSYVGGNEFNFTAINGFSSPSSNAIYTWNFGDGTTGTGNPINHVYAVTGNQNYTVTVTVSDSLCNGSASMSINAPMINCGITLQDIPQTVNSYYFYTTPFTNSNLNNPVYSLDFGDGNSTSTIPVTHTYSNAYYSGQNYTVILTTQDSLCVDSDTITIWAQGIPPSCGATSTITQDSLNMSTYHFEANGFSGAHTVNWYFGDGNNSSLNPTSHTYAVSTAPYYSYVVVALDSTCLDTIYNSINVTNSGSCNANFTLGNQPSNPAVYNGYNYSLCSGVGGCTSYLWDFGDGGTSTAQYPSYTYNSLGVFDICLTVSNNTCTDSMCVSITVVNKVSGTTINILDPNSTNSIFEQEVKKLNIFPNPNQGEFTIELSSNQEKNSTLSIIDLQGRSIYSEAYQVNKGANQISINLKNKQAGIYFIKLDEHIVEKIIIE